MALFSSRALLALAAAASTLLPAASYRLAETIKMAYMDPLSGPLRLSAKACSTTGNSSPTWPTPSNGRASIVLD